MRKRLLSYLRQIDALLDNAVPGAHLNTVLEDHLRQIAFFQHERLIHLLVTLAFGLMAIAAAIVLYLRFSLVMAVLLMALLCLLIPYIFHYYIQENGVQKMYRQYDRIWALKSEPKDDPER